MDACHTSFLLIVNMQKCTFPLSLSLFLSSYPWLFNSFECVVRGNHCHTRMLTQLLRPPNAKNTSTKHIQFGINIKGSTNEFSNKFRMRLELFPFGLHVFFLFDIILGLSENCPSIFRSNCSKTKTKSHMAPE